MFKKILPTMLLLTTMLLNACGGGGSSAPTAPKTVSGIAAAGAAITGTVYLKDSAATPLERTCTTTDGSFTFDVTGLTAPFVLKVVGSAGASSYTLYSLASEAGTANINPLSNTVLSVAASGCGSRTHLQCSSSE